MLLVAVDNSFSMRAGDRLDASEERQALEALRRFDTGDRGQVISFCLRRVA